MVNNEWKFIAIVYIILHTSPANRSIPIVDKFKKKIQPKYEYENKLEVIYQHGCV